MAAIGSRTHRCPSIARLFLWSLFTAGSHRTSVGQRVYIFVDEAQQIISDGVKLIFEQFRDIGGTIIAAHQTGAVAAARHGLVRDHRFMHARQTYLPRV